MGAGGTSNCSLYLTGGYRDARIMVFKESTVTSCSKGNSDGIWRERSSDQAAKAVEQVAQRNCRFSILSKLNQIRPDQPHLTVNLTLL